MMWFRKETNTTDANKIHGLVVVWHQASEDRASPTEGWETQHKWMNAKPYPLIDFFPFPGLCVYTSPRKAAGDELNCIKKQ